MGDKRQKRASRWARTFWPGRSVELHALKLAEEVGEVAECFVKPHKRKGLGEELADVVILAYIIAEEEGVNLQRRIDRKMDVNERKKHA